MLQTILNVVLILLIIGVVVMAVLYFLGSKLQKRQLEQEQLLEAAAQTVSLLVIDKKKVKMTQAVQAGLPKMVLDQTPRYLRWTKVPIVKAKIGPKIVTLVADERVFQTLPVKTELRASGAEAFRRLLRKKDFSHVLKRIRKKTKRSKHFRGRYDSLESYRPLLYLSLHRLHIHRNITFRSMLIIDIQRILHLNL